MSKKSPVAVFLAASAILATSALQGDITKAEEQKGIGGWLKEWTTDQEVDEESTLDEKAKKAKDATIKKLEEKAKKKSKKADICIPIGEGENCW